MAESHYVTIEGAAQRCGVHPKTIQRAIRKGRLPARYPQSNRCEIAVSDLDTFLPGHVQIAKKQCLPEEVSGHIQAETEQRVAALEQRVQQLEQQLEALLSGQEGPKLPYKTKPRERTTGQLPKHLVSLLAFANRHNVAETKVLTHVDMSLLPVKRGAWTVHDSTSVRLALDTKGRQAFYQFYRELPHFTRCNKCPHGYLDTV